MSLPEVKLWQHLRGNGAGVKFRRQHPIGPYVADFYCAAAKLIIEIDGSAHDMGDRPSKDQQRDRWLEGRGYRIVRVPAKDVLNDANAVADALMRLVQSLR